MRRISLPWVGVCGVRLQPLVDALKRHVLACTVVHADETSVAMLASGKGKGKTPDQRLQVHQERARPILHNWLIAQRSKVVDGGATATETAFCHLSSYLQATGEGKSGCLWVFIRSASLRTGCLATSSLSNPIRMNTGYNLLKLHS